MARIQDIKELEERIGRAVDEYLKYSEDYTNPVLNVRLDKETGLHTASVEDATELKDGMFLMVNLVTADNEPDCDKLGEIANSFLFIE